MSRLINICILLLGIGFWGCDTAGNVDPSFRHRFMKYYGSAGDQYAADLIVNDDGSMFILGNTISLSGERSAFIIKVDREGNILNERKVGAANQVAVDMEPVKNVPGHLVVALNFEEGSTSRIRLVEVDNNLEVIKSEVIPLHLNGGTRQVARSVTSLNSGDFVIAGYADRTLVTETVPVVDIDDRSDILAFRLNSALILSDTVVTKGGERDGCGVKIFEMSGTNEGKLVLFSYTDRPHLSDRFGYNFSFDIISNGTPIGKLVGADADEEVLNAVIEVPFLNGGGYLMAGTARSSSTGPGDIYLVRYDEEFQQRSIDSRLSLGRNMECVSVSNAASGFYVVANEQPEGIPRDITLSKVNSAGEHEWSTSFGTREGDDTAVSVATLPDGRVVVLGTMQLPTMRKIALIVLDKNGNF